MTKYPPALWVIVGATGTGKTDYSLKLARELKESRPSSAPQIINADSMQFYRGMDIGTAKLSATERSLFPHHMFDVLDVTQESTVAWYQPVTRNLIKSHLQLGNDVILVGGSGLYVSSVIYDFKFPPRDQKVREELEKKLLNEGLESVLKELNALSPESFNEVDKNNPRRVVRALEIARLGEKGQVKLPDKPKLWWPKTRIIGLHLDRGKLVSRLDERLINMWRNGLLEEVRELIPHGLEGSPTASRAIGYEQALDQIRGEASESEAIAKAQSLTRRYARRQVSWFKRYQEIVWIDAETGLEL